MTLVGAKRLLVALTAIFSLAVSAVSACACSHHEPVAKRTEVRSCHGSSHDAAAAAQFQVEASSESIETGCNCFVRAPIAAIVAKSGEKKSPIDKQIGDVKTSVCRDLFAAASYASPAATNPRDIARYSRDLLLSLPARAPPRL